jgi:DNA-binding LacI/PurR family transcriptional regulator
MPDTNGTTTTPPERVTLARVAELAGVAESTASRVINGYTENFRVRPEVRKRVLEAARKLNYRPNPMVRSISAKKTNLVAVVGWASDGVNRTALAEAVRVLKAAGKHVCTTFLDPDYSGHELPSWRVDGAIALQVRDPADVVELERQALPYVSINGMSGPGGDEIIFDEAQGTEMALEHLVALGHQKFAYCFMDKLRPSPRGIRHSAVGKRRDALIAGLEARGLPPAAGIDRFDLDPMGFCREVIVPHGVTAVVGFDDVTAAYLVQSLQAMGKSVPRDVSVVSFNDELPSRMSSPPLTTVALPAAEAGRRAGEMLLERLSTDDAIERRVVVLTETLVERRSTGRVGG